MYVKTKMSVSFSSMSKVLLICLNASYSIVKRFELCSKNLLQI